MKLIYSFVVRSSDSSPITYSFWSCPCGPKIHVFSSFPVRWNDPAVRNNHSPVMQIRERVLNTFTAKTGMGHYEAIQYLKTKLPFIK